MTLAASNQQTETRLHLCGQWLTPLPEGGLWWNDRRTLIVSDLHLEKGSSFAARGQMLPPYDSAATLRLVEHLVKYLDPVMVVSLGDSFHDPAAETRLSDADSQSIRALTSAVDWVWVEGNHDPDPPAHLGGRAAKTLRLDPLVFRHEPTGEIGEVSGHLHPAAKVASKHRALRRRCFVTDGQRLVMPAMGAFTGGLNVQHTAFTEAFPDGGKMVFMMGADRVYPVMGKRLLDDGPRGGYARWRKRAERGNG